MKNKCIAKKGFFSKNVIQEFSAIKHVFTNAA